MKNKLIALFVSMLLPTLLISNASANENTETVGGYAIVNPETGIVHGVIVATSSDPFNNGGTMPGEYMGCPAGCVIVQQSTADQNGNVSGVRSEDNKTVSYIENRNIFQVVETNSIQNQTIIESVSNSSFIETDIIVSRSARFYEFGVQDLVSTNGNFQLTEVEPPQNTSAQISATTKQFLCEESEFLCSSRNSTSSNILVDESIYFNERSTASQVETKIILEAKNKIKEQLGLILSMLEKWIIK